jgi:hypothetical protein
LPYIDKYKAILGYYLTIVVSIIVESIATVSVTIVVSTFTVSTEVVLSVVGEEQATNKAAQANKIIDFFILIFNL